VVDRVAVFDTIEAPQGHTAGIRVVRIDTEHVVLDPALERLLLRDWHARLALGRHEPGACVQQHPEPEILVQDLRIGFETVEGDLALVVAIAVALVAVLFENGDDGRGEDAYWRVFRYCGSGGQGIRGGQCCREAESERHRGPKDRANSSNHR